MYTFRRSIRGGKPQLMQEEHPRIAGVSARIHGAGAFDLNSSVILSGVTERRRHRIFDVLSRRQPDLTVLAEDVYKPHNLSAILRSCDAVGIGEVHAVKPTGGVATYNATSASAEKWVDLVVHDSIGTAAATLKERGYTLYAAHLSAEAVDYRDVSYLEPCAVLLGNEKEGVSPEAANVADRHIIIPMLGMVQSLNVSVAAAVILFEAQRQRRDADMYASPRLTPLQTREVALRWLSRSDAALLAQEPLLPGESEPVNQ